MSTIAARENIYELFGEKSNGEAEVIANVKIACDKVGYISTDASADCNKFMDFVNSLTCMSKRTCKSQDGKDQFSVISHDLYDKERIGVMSQWPLRGTSIKNLLHMGQLFKSGVTARYDYGFRENWSRYDQIVPPVVDFSQVKNPVSMHVAVDDNLGDKEDNLEVKDKFDGRVVFFEVVGTDLAPVGGEQMRMDHAAIMNGRDTTWFKSIIKLLEQHNHS